ncbi:DUF3883 domain-containing protein [Mesorhizobium sp. M0848]|uniref:DUF3883 domain-containing protein n=1 Tax=Mesorhizobium sp. M0848 TaxID=2957012 RepID=UPI00333DF8D9
MLNAEEVTDPSKPITLNYEADLLGNIQQALAGLQGFGIMALELIQNADDAGADSLVFDVTDGGLFVRNNAEFSTCGLREIRCPWERDGDPEDHKRACNFHAISRMGSRNKIRVASQIGRFGIGFVSVYQVTDAPIVRSTGIEMQLIPIDGSGVTTVIPRSQGTEFELSWAALASDTRKGLNASPTPPDVVPLVVDAIAEVMVRGLFFLRSLQRIELFRNGDLVRSASIARDGGVVDLEIKPEGRHERWKILTRDASDLATERGIFDDFPTLLELDRSPIVSIALPIHEEPVEGLLYAYLPTEQASGLPLHINADFFPHPTRRTITLTGEQHERYWNELLLDTAARALAESFEAVRDLIGPRRLWALAASAYGLKDKPSFNSFWLEMQVVAKTSRSVLTVDNEMALPSECHLPEQLLAEGQAALASIGLKLLHPDLRPFWSVFQTLAASPLRLAALVAALETAEITAESPHLRNLWAAVDAILTQSKGRPDLPTLVGRLKAVKFILDTEGMPASIADLYRPTVGISTKRIHRFLPRTPLVHHDVLALEALAALIDVYRFDDFARDFATAIPDEETAIAVIGLGDDGQRELYDLLPAFVLDGVTTASCARVANTPLLRTRSGFVEPSRGQLPGGFVDPVGYFELVDTRLMSDAVQAFAKDHLRVDVLTFQAYIDDHLEDILKEEPSQEQYIALLNEILKHRAELDAGGGLRSLAGLPFVRTRTGTYVRPSECYFWSPTIDALLGGDERYFVDENWMPPGQAAARFQDVLEGPLGMRRTVSIEHLVSRIDAVASTGTIDEIADRTQPIVRHILDRFARLTAEERTALEQLRTISWLPASLNGERVGGNRFAPTLLYRSFRAAGYASQVNVVDLPILRGGGQTSRSLVDFLDFLGLKPEPPTEVIVAHLEHCMENGTPASDVVYAMLSERLGGEGAASIDRLSGTAFIYDPELDEYFRTDQVFWEPTYFRGYWHAPSPRMRLREPLYRHLGVEDVPTAANYVALLKGIATKAIISEIDADVHRRCLAWLANALERDDQDALTELRAVGQEPVLLNLLGVTIWPDEAAWLDSPVLVEPFAGALDERLVSPPAVSRIAATRLYRELGVAGLSEIARLALAELPDGIPAPEATERLQARGDLLLWLAPNVEFHDRLRSILSRIEVQTVERLQVHVEIVEYDPVVRSPVSQADAYFDAKSSILYVRAGPGESFDWSAAFKAIFSPLEQLTIGVDMPPVIMTAAYLVTMPTRDGAERALRNANYHPPEGPYEHLPETEELRDTQDDDVVQVFEDDEEAPGSGETQGPVDEKPFDKGAAGEGAGDGHAEHLSPQKEDEEAQTEEVAGTDGTGDATGPEAATPPRTGEGGDAESEDAPFLSKADQGGFGAEPGESSDDETSGGRGWGARPRDRQGPSRAERQERRSRLLSYVNATPREDGSGDQRMSAEDIGPLIDDGAIEAVLRYEKRAGRDPIEQPHNNPGFDIVSDLPRRLIEVKGLEGEWTERGVKLSHVQFAMAQAYPGEYWLYVVEHARDLKNQRVHAIANPFSKVVEYWFDHGWKGVVEEVVAAADLNLEIGVRLRHPLWGIGTIEQINRHGLAISLLMNFGDESGKLIPFNSSLEFVD